LGKVVWTKIISFDNIRLENKENEVCYLGKVV